MEKNSSKGGPDNIFPDLSNPSVKFPMNHQIIVRPDPPGKYTAYVVGFPEIRAVATTEEDAIENARQSLVEWLKDARLVQVEVPVIGERNPALAFFGYSKDDPYFDEYLEEIAKFRREVDERECPNSSSTPIT